MSDHTPGPWKLKRDRSGEEYGAVVGGDGELVATTGYRVRPGSDEDDSNARLIAAAPDLLEAGQALTSLWYDGLSLPRDHSLMQAAIEQLESAINKATIGR